MEGNGEYNVDKVDKVQEERHKQNGHDVLQDGDHNGLSSLSNRKKGQQTKDCMLLKIKHYGLF